MKLYLSNAIEFVRSRMDELSYSNDDMIVPADDDRNFDNTVEKLLPEAAEYTYLAAPVTSVSPSDGFQFRVTEDEVFVFGNATFGSDSVQGGLVGDVADLFFDTTNTGLRRILSLQYVESGIDITHFVPNDSPEARMQLNPYTKGTADNPVAVMRTAQTGVGIKYYSVNEGDESAMFQVRVITAPKYATDKSGAYIFCPDRLNYAVLNRLTAMVLDAYNDQRAQLFYQKANSYIQ